MGKPFFYRIDAQDLGAEVFSRSDDELVSWIKSFTISLMRSKPSCDLSKKVIDEAVTFKQKKRKAAEKRWNQQKEDTQVMHCISNANAQHMPETETETETETKLNINKERKEKFETWWCAYQKKIDRKKVEKKWLSLKDEEIEKCCSVVDRYVKSKPDPKYRKNPLTYLNGDCWNDEIIQENQDKTKHNGRSNERKSMMDEFRANQKAIEEYGQ